MDQTPPTEKQLAAKQMIAAGMSNRQVAAKLSVSQRTIETWSPSLRAALAQECTSVAAPKDAASSEAPQPAPEPSEAHPETPSEALERIQRTIEKTKVRLTALDTEARLVDARRTVLAGKPYATQQAAATAAERATAAATAILDARARLLAASGIPAEPAAQAFLEEAKAAAVVADQAAQEAAAKHEEMRQSYTEKQGELR
jgi:hypothetical protein